MQTIGHLDNWPFNDWSDSSLLEISTHIVCFLRLGVQEHLIGWIGCIYPLRLSCLASISSSPCQWGCNLMSWDLHRVPFTSVIFAAGFKWNCFPCGCIWESLDIRICTWYTPYKQHWDLTCADFLRPLNVWSKKQFSRNYMFKSSKHRLTISSKHISHLVIC
jgi:hypothetical protein